IELRIKGENGTIWAAKVFISLPWDSEDINWPIENTRLPLNEADSKVSKSSIIDESRKTYLTISRNASCESCDIECSLPWDSEDINWPIENTRLPLNEADSKVSKSSIIDESRKTYLTISRNASCESCDIEWSTTSSGTFLLELEQRSTIYDERMIKGCGDDRSLPWDSEDINWPIENTRLPLNEADSKVSKSSIIDESRKTYLTISRNASCESCDIEWSTTSSSTAVVADDPCEAPRQTRSYTASTCVSQATSSVSFSTRYYIHTFLVTF
uniref:Ig-like domain-containing protein n=1 Tax=Ascaris lumbricoides TaxID=6252 RepID=A0A0M3IQ12_ASCLU